MQRPPLGAALRETPRITADAPSDVDAPRVRFASAR
jgi:hypothetical protein